MLRISNLSLPLGYDDAAVRRALLNRLSVPASALLGFTLVRRSVDARDKRDIHFVVSLDISLRDEASVLKRCRFLSPSPVRKSSAPVRVSLPSRPLVVGAGPAGLFAALTLARAGAAPVLIERGRPAPERTVDVLRLQSDGILDPESNVQFGEGGAGAFSDGKLTCGIKSPFMADVLRTLADHGAPEDILVDQKPHIGTDLLRKVTVSIRNEIISLGGEVRFSTRLEELIIQGGRINGAVLGNSGSRYEFLTDCVMLCIGHSARDTVRGLFGQGVRMEKKPFAMGVRIEHPRAFIDKAQYGTFAGHPALGAASYKLVCHTPDGRGVYTFCMCPGGRVIAAASEEGGVVTNGMSFHARDDENSNSALLVGVRTEDFGSDHVLSGMELQRRIEAAAFTLAGGGYRAPAQRVEDFLSGRQSRAFGDVVPSYLPGVVPCDLAELLPSFITEDLRFGIKSMDRQLRGFAMPDAVLTGPETRSSSPVRFSRDESGEAEGISGLYPVGEGAGFAGGIVSAAIDGISSARRLMEKYSRA